MSHEVVPEVSIFRISSARQLMVTRYQLSSAVVNVLSSTKRVYLLIHVVQLSRSSMAPKIKGCLLDSTFLYI